MTNKLSSEALNLFRDKTESVIDEIEKVVFGKRQTLQKILAVILTEGGHILLEDYPGLAKTLTAKSFAAVLGLEFKRIQFTPDLLPNDITGGYLFDPNQNSFYIKKGPVFSNIVLADEINRASPKTQSALLEAMQEKQVTLEGETYQLEDPFIVFATQNPVEYAGTFPLPEAQLDRFSIRLEIGYPEPQEEIEILENRISRKADEVPLEAVVSREDLIWMRGAVEDVYVDPDLQKYIVALVNAVRKHPKAVVGVSPRGSLALMKLSRAWAALNGRNFVLPDDIKEFSSHVFTHRIILEPSIWSADNAAAKIVADVLRSVPVPIIKESNDK